MITTPGDLDGLIADCGRRGETLGRPRGRWTKPQRALFDSPYRVTVWRGANGIGKSVALAELTRRSLGAELYWQRPGPNVTLLVGKTWAQLGSTLKYLWGTIDRRWFKGTIRFEAGGLKGQRMQVFDIVDGPCKGGELRCGIFRAENLAGPRASTVISDEPIPESVYNELWPRLLGRGGRIYMGFTTTIGTEAKLDYLWDLVDDDSKPWAGELVTELSLEAVTLEGGLVPVSWMTAQEIAEFEDGLSAIERDMRMGRTRHPRMDSAYFSAWGPHLVMDPQRMDSEVPDGTPVGVGIDHGSKPGAQRATLAAVGGRSLAARAWALGHYKGDGRTESEQDARGILEMLADNGLTVQDVDLWVGDRAHHGDFRGGRKSNERLKAAIAKQIGLDTNRRGWADLLPRPLRYMQTPRKYDRSVWEGCEILHRMMVADPPRLRLSKRCGALADDLTTWQGSKTDPAKDGIDSLRYVVVPMTEGRRR